MVKKEFDKNHFQFKNKLAYFLIIFFLTILITRIFISYKDLDIFLFGYELHHFYYGVTLLVILNIAILFGRFHPKLYTCLSAFALGLIADEFLFIMKGLRNSEYPSTTTHMIFIVVVILTILGIILIDVIGRFKRHKSKTI